MSSSEASVRAEALESLLIDKGLSIEQISLISFIYIFLSLILLFINRNNLNPYKMK